MSKDHGLSGRNMRLAMARQAIADLQTETEPDRRLALMKLVERLTSGRKVRTKKQVKADVFQ